MLIPRPWRLYAVERELWRQVLLCLPSTTSFLGLEAIRGMDQHGRRARKSPSHSLVDSENQRSLVPQGIGTREVMCPGLTLLKIRNWLWYGHIGTFRVWLVISHLTSVP